MQAALGLIDALEQAYTHIARHPATGSTRYALELNLPGLRSWPLKNYPYLVFYVERADSIDVCAYCTPSGIFLHGYGTNQPALQVFDGIARRDQRQFTF